MRATGGIVSIYISTQKSAHIRVLRRYIKHAIMADTLIEMDASALQTLHRIIFVPLRPVWELQHRIADELR